MNYYIIEKKIYGYEEPFDEALYNYPKLNEAQSAFYEANLGAGLNEVLAMTLNPIQEPTINELKEQRIQMCSEISFEKRKEVCPDYKNDNAVLGLYPPEIKARIIECNTAFRSEYYRIKSIVEACVSIQELEAIECGYDSLVNQFSDLRDV